MTDDKKDLNSFDTSDPTYLSDNDDNSTVDDLDDNNDNNENDECNKKKKKKSKKMPITEAIKTTVERSLFVKIDRFFKKQCSEKQINKMINIINNCDNISLRLLNWFAMKHSATMEALEIVDNDGSIKLFDVKISYKARLWTHSKKYFDPFRRGKRFDYHFDENTCIETTLCQLNFFRWLFLHDLMNYVEEYYDKLKQKMGHFEKNKKDTKNKIKIKKTIVKIKKEDAKNTVKRFNDEDGSKLVIII